MGELWLGKIIGYGGGEGRRYVEDLILRSLLPPDFFRLDFYGENPAAKANAIASPDSNPPLRYCTAIKMNLP